MIYFSTVFIFSAYNCYSFQPWAGTSRFTGHDYMGREIATVSCSRARSCVYSNGLEPQTPSKYFFYKPSNRPDDEDTPIIKLIDLVVTFKA